MAWKHELGQRRQLSASKPSPAEFDGSPACLCDRPRVPNGQNTPVAVLPGNSRRKGLALVARRKGALKGREALLERYPLGLLFGDLRAQLLLERGALSLVFGNLRTQLFDLLGLFLGFVQQHRDQL